MELTSILSIAMSGLIMIVLTHIAVFWVVRSLYPPAPQVVYYPQNVIVPPQSQPVLTQPPRQEQTESVNVPTYQAPLQLEAANQEGSTNINSFLASPPTGGDSGLVAAHA